MSLPPLNRIPTIALIVAVLAIAVAGGAYASGGGREITVCVHHKNGGLYKARKCARHDSKLTWNVQGLPGQNGKNGNPGANGAVAGFSASGAALVDLTSTSVAAPATVLTKNLPAGSFIVNAKTSLTAGTLATSEFAHDICTLSDTSVSDTSEWSSAVNVPGTSHYFADGTVSLDIAMSTAAPSTVTLSCYNNFIPQASFTTGAKNSQIDAIQTSSNS